MAKKSKRSVVLQIDLTQYGWTLKRTGKKISLAEASGACAAPLEIASRR
jgi:hypothetical protein